MRLVLALCLFLVAPALGGPVALVDVFCDALLAHDETPSSLAASDALWSDLAVRLERRATQAIPRDAARQACADRFTVDFEEGEFVLTGRDLVARAAVPSPAARSDDTAGGVTTLEVPLMGSVTIDESIPAPGPDEGAGLDIAARGTRYESLWQDFLSRLRARFAALAIPVQLAVSMK